MRLSRIPENLLLRSASRAKRASNQLKHVVFDTGDELWASNATLPYALFPLRGVVSLQTPAGNGKHVEVALVGPEGVADVSSFLSLTFAVGWHFRRLSKRILFAFNGGTTETRQVKTLPLF